MKSEEAEKKRKYHQARVKFYSKKEDEAKINENRIGFKLNRDQ